MKTTTTKITRAAAALERLMAGRQQRKITGQVTGRAAEQWDTLQDLGKAIGINVDEILALLLLVSHNALLKEFKDRLEEIQAKPAARS